MKLNNLVWAVSTVALSMAAFGAPAMAQDADVGATGGELEEIVVTARKTAENLQDIPVAVTAYSGEQLQQQSAVKVQDIARLTPSLRMSESASNASALTTTIRGQVQTDILATLDPSVGTYVDGVYWSRAYGLNSDLLDVQSVQVLKGPQGTLFGRNTTGGAILFQTNDPSYSGVSGMLQGSYGSYDEMIGTAVLNVPVISDKLAIRAAVQKNQRDGYIRDVTSGRDINDRDNWSGRLKIRANPTDNFEVILSGETFNMDAVSPVRQLALMLPSGAAVAGAANVADYLNGLTFGASGSDDDAVALNQLPHTKAKTNTYSGTFTLDTDLATFKYIVGYRNVKSFSAIDLDGSPFDLHYTEGTQDLEQMSHELQATGDAFDGALKFAIGGFYFTEEGTDSSMSLTLNGPNASIFSGTIDNKSQGVYGQATWRATDALSITAGLRYSEEEKGLDSRNRDVVRANGSFTCAIIVPGQIPAADCLQSRSDTFDGVSYTFGVDYKITPDVLVYAKTGKGFRSGGQNLRAVSIERFVPFAPEEAVDYELGLKSTFLDRRVRFNLAVYQTNVEDIQRTTILLENGKNSTILGNAGEIRIRGLEAELDALVTEELRISATAALTDPKYLEYIGANGADRSGERVASVPEQTFTLAATWTKDFDFGELSLRGDYAYNDSFALDAYNTPSNVNNAAIIAATTQPAAGVVNLRAAVKLANENWELAAFARNVTDNRDPVNALLVNPLYVSQVLRDPRTVGFQATYRFGE